MNKMIETSVSGKYVLECEDHVNIHTGPYRTCVICGTEIINQWNGVHMYNCGQEKYIRKIWNKRYASK